MRAFQQANQKNIARAAFAQDYDVTASADSNELLKFPFPQANSWCCGRRLRL